MQPDFATLMQPSLAEFCAELAATQPRQTLSWAIFWMSFSISDLRMVREAAGS
ncbi:hypothetical protein SMD11_0616 [Streptomyces albireticuli]|uniref:Uncharacterized protein n=1 Tax=Streptomyces albireticuli TaxID=1940 RepID=A0A1Z2KW64_9ACTN|nr:hypothetical protein SMD11_0616 [Streptomyces albireticuli]